MKGHVVAYAITRNQTKVTLSRLLKEFITKIDVGPQIQTFVVGKDAVEIAAIKGAIPNVNILLCRFHVALTLRDAVSKCCEAKEKVRANDHLMRMLYTDSGEIFVTYLEQFSDKLKLYTNRTKHSWA
ncbi:structural maintenance of chromosomes protein 6 [Elysia marginata]|uniref:Structural maintenance of chromosomes protein 6 n=1 Tax=Elysia marginata TaxID=1093978 RepID=A0AAV4JRX0_9GAST|nr:structural maintenance of chromosomes protein 6 [Elysia marginata]